MALIILFGTLGVLGIFWLVFASRGRDMEEMPFGPPPPPKKPDDKA